MPTVAVLTPSATGTGGVERYCRLLVAALEEQGHRAVLFEPGQRVPTSDLLVTNGMLSTRGRQPRVHVFHGCWWNNTRTQRWGGPLTSARITATGVAREVYAGLGALRVAVSAAAAADVHRAYRFDVPVVVPNPVDTTVFGPRDDADARARWGLPDSEPLALFVGRDEPLKRFPLAQAAARACGYTLVTAGPHRLGDVPLGTVAPEDLAQVLAAVDVLLSPSAYEGSGLAVLEALASGTPAVATRTGCIPEILDEVPGYEALTAAVDDLEQLSAALRAVGPGTQEAVAQAASLVRREHSLAAFGAHWQALVDRALGAR